MNLQEFKPRGSSRATIRLIHSSFCSSWSGQHTLQRKLVRSFRQGQILFIRRECCRQIYGIQSALAAPCTSALCIWTLRKRRMVRIPISNKLCRAPSGSETFVSYSASTGLYCRRTSAVLAARSSMFPGPRRLFLSSNALTRWNLSETVAIGEVSMWGLNQASWRLSRPETFKYEASTRAIV